VEQKDFIGLYEDAVPKELCDEIIKVFEESADMVFIQKGEHQIPEDGKLFREDDSLTLDELSPTLGSDIFIILNDKIAKYSDEYASLRTQTLKTIRLKIQRTQIGGGYHQWHCENSSLERSNRELAWTIYLNDVEEGGETEYLYQHRRIQPKTGTLAIFPCAFTHTHRGNPPLSNVKYILTGWYNHY
tara:strand:+ start:92 stop:652 length:561 start_codon:yes stop_codon:yes gene_type:complete